jgi:hypothetical protein
VEVVFLHLDAGDVYLYFNKTGINAVYGGAESFIKHSGTRIVAGTEQIKRASLSRR